MAPLPPVVEIVQDAQDIQTGGRRQYQLRAPIAGFGHPLDVSKVFELDDQLPHRRLSHIRSAGKGRGTAPALVELPEDRTVFGPKRNMPAAVDRLLQFAGRLEVGKHQQRLSRRIH